jgi:hypothetical protein
MPKLWEAVRAEEREFELSGQEARESMSVMGFFASYDFIVQVTPGTSFHLPLTFSSK